MNTRKLALTAGALAGLAALPLTTASAATGGSLPQGSASASALTVSLSTAPIRNLADMAAPVTSFQQLANELASLQTTLCGPSGLITSVTACPVNLDILNDLPQTLKVAVAQSSDSAVLNAPATDLTSGTASSTPLYTNWMSVNADLTNLTQNVTSLVDGVLTQLDALNVTGAVQAITSGLSAPSLDLSGLDLSKVISIQPDNLMSTVTANLNQAGKTNVAFQKATAVSLNGKALDAAGQSTDLSGLQVQVDPFDACAAGAAQIAQCENKSGAQASAENTLVSASLPALNVAGLDTSSLTSLASTLNTLVNTLTSVLANPTQATSILDTASSTLAGTPLAAPLSTLGTLVNGAVSSTTLTIGTDLLTQWKAQLTSIDTQLNAVINALAALQLPDVTKLIGSSLDFATAKTTPTAQGGVVSTATSSIGSLSILPMGASLSSAVNSALKLIPSVGGLTLNQVSADTALLKIDGITSSAEAAVGQAPACDSTGDYFCATSGLKTVSVLGQVIDLDNGTLNGVKLLPALGPGQELRHTFGLPGVGAVTLDIVRGLPQVAINTDNERGGSVSALDVRLINGTMAGDCTGTCSDPLGALPNTASPNQTGIVALGKDGDTVVDTSLANAAVDAAIVPSGPGNKVDTPSGCGITVTCPTSTVASQTSLPSTGMFGGGALPAGLGLIAVAISLRLVPSLRLRLRRVR